jgi:hypothetical protein
MTQGHRQLTLTKPHLQESARLVASPMLCHNHAGTGTAARAVGETAGTGTAGGVGLESLRDDWGIAVTGESICGDVNSIAFVLCVTKLQKV